MLEILLKKFQETYAEKFASLVDHIDPMEVRVRALESDNHYLRGQWKAALGEIEDLHARVDAMEARQSVSQ
jgi:hypothetical protein